MKAIYIFNLEGKLIEEIESANSLSLKYGISVGSITSSIHKKQCNCKKYYLSYNRDFKIPITKKNHNPLLSKTNSAYNLSIQNSILQEVDNYFRSSESALFC